MNKKRNVEPLIPIGVVGCFSEVWLTRKYVQLCRALGWTFDVRRVADIYPKKDVEDEETLKKIFEDIKEARLRKPIDPFVEAYLMSGILSGRIKYSQVNGSDLPEDLLYDIEAIDISSPNLFHYSQFQKVIDFQKSSDIKIHTQLEKPVVVSLEEVNGMELFLNFNSPQLEELVLIDAEHYSHYGPTRYLRRNFQRLIDEEGLGKVTSIQGYILENDDFSNERNKSIIDVNVSGGGLWLDTGIHLLAFLRYLGAEMNYEATTAQRFKSSDPNIQDDCYMETAMHASVPIKPNDYFADGCVAELDVAKCYPENKKGFFFECENGSIEADIVNKKLLVKKTNHNGKCIESIEASFPMDAFYYVLSSFHNSIKNRNSPETSYRTGLLNVRDNRLIYHRAGDIQMLEEGQTHIDWMRQNG